ncbi:MAG TPA: pirin family protein [Cytophagaceae bacterium]|jgi:redox-sensitive bicupin YhaK (pirin superfamily)|nr:pirin family protein [Cytophagaceae bacterium]
MKRTTVVYFVWLLFAGSTITNAQKAKDIRREVADEVEEGDGATVRRLIPVKGIKNYDPYVLFDDFSITPPSGFPDHFHSGFEVVTYVVQGQLQHKDSRGNQIVLGAGDIQCFSTGSGVVHSEMPLGTEQVRGFQIWINLPKEFKNMAPGYQSVKASNVPTTKVNDEVTIKTIVAQGATVRLKAEVLIEEIRIRSGGLYKVTLPKGYNGFVYVSSGSSTIEGYVQAKGTAVFFTSQDLEIRADQETVLLLVSGLPLGEPIHRKGSIVK